MKTPPIRLFISFILVTAIIVIVLPFIFKRGHVNHQNVWRTVLIIFTVVILTLNLKPHWSFEKRHHAFVELFRKSVSPQLDSLLLDHGREDLLKETYRPLAHLLSMRHNPVVCTNNSVEVITDGQRKYDLLMQDLENAKESIHMEYFHFGADSGSREIRNMLIKKAREGVKVRFINENVANLPIIHRYYRSMKKGGVEVIRFTGIKRFIGDFLTKLNYRNHRKIVVIDGRIGYTGGMNINDHYFHQWRDTHLRIEGDAVSSLQVIFLDSWIGAGGSIDDFMDCFPTIERQRDDVLMQVVPDEPGRNSRPIQMGYVWSLLHAKGYVYIQTPYFAPTEPVLEALKSAALQGVDVRVMLPQKSDTWIMGPANRSYYKECLLAGVKIYERTGPFMHAKTYVQDDYLSVIGTSNMDGRSLIYNYEDNAYIYDERTACCNRDIFLSELEICEEITLDDVSALSWHQRFLQHLVRFSAPVL
jgi:cardiolipin synthase